MPNPVMHFEIIDGEGSAIQDFYRNAFGLSVDDNNPMNYGMVDTDYGAGIRGGIGPEEKSRVSVYVEVPDLPAAVAKVEQLGAKVILQPAEVPGGPRIAIFLDPADNTIGLLKAQSM